MKNDYIPTEYDYKYQIGVSISQAVVPYSLLLSDKEGDVIWMLVGNRQLVLNSSRFNTWTDLTLSVQGTDGLGVIYKTRSNWKS